MKLQFKDVKGIHQMILEVIIQKETVCFFHLIQTV